MSTSDQILDIQARFAAEFIYSRSRNPELTESERLCLEAISQILLKMADIIFDQAIKNPPELQD